MLLKARSLLGANNDSCDSQVILRTTDCKMTFFFNLFLFTYTYNRQNSVFQNVGSLLQSNFDDQTLSISTFPINFQRRLYDKSKLLVY